MIESDSHPDPIVLPLPASGTIKYIVHISDIHIRNGSKKESRQNEYLSVFKKLFKKLKEYPQDILNSTVIIITGDFFHTKNRIDANSGLLFNYLLGHLGNIAPVYIIQGNHDYRQDLGTDNIDTDLNNTLDLGPVDEYQLENECPDVLTSLFYQTKRNNVVYLEKTGCYIASNIGFGLVSVKDTLIPGDTRGQVDNLPLFPNSFPSNIELKVALFHGTMINTKYDLYTSSNSDGYPLDWIKGYDIWLLGDIHLQQIHNATKINDTQYQWSLTKPTWAYSGSLIQQTHGETVTGHGYLFWNLTDKTTTFVDIPNDYGKLTLKFHDNNWIIKNEGSWDAPAKSHTRFLKDFSLSGKLPKRFVTFKTEGKYTEEIIQNLTTDLNTYAIDQYELIRGNIYSDDSLDHSPNISMSTEFQSYNSPDKWIEYVNNNAHNLSEEVPWKIWLKSPDTMTLQDNETLPKTIRSKILEKNKDILKDAEKLMLNKTFMKTKLKLLHIEWQWLFGYGDSNWFDFTLANGHICEIKGENGIGKSSFYEIIYISLFGKGIPKRSHKLSGLVCSIKPQKSTSETTIEFSLSDKNKYCIIREFNQKDNSTEMKCWLYKWDNNSYIPLKSGVTAVSSWIDENIGNFEQFLLTIMITQGCDEDFFSHDSIKQMAFLDRALDIEKITQLKNLLHICSVAHQSIYREIKDYDDAIPIPHSDPKSIQDVALQQTQMLSHIAKLEHRLEFLQFDVKNINDLQLDEKELHAKLATINNELDSLETIDSYEELIVSSTRYDTLMEPLMQYSEQADYEIKISNGLPDIEQKYNEMIQNTSSAIIIPTKSLKQILDAQNLITQKLKDLNIIHYKNIHSYEDLQLGIKAEKSLKDRITALQEQTNTFLEKRPNKPKITINDVITIENNYNSTYHEFNTLSKYFDSNPLTDRLEEPKYTLEQLNNLTNMIRLDIARLENTNWINLSNDDLDILITEMKTKQTDLEETIKLQNLEILQSTHNEIRNDLKNLENSLYNLKNHMPSRYSSQVADEWFKSFENDLLNKESYELKAYNLNKLLDEQQAKSDLILKNNLEINSLTERLNEYQGIEYNENCPACRKNPGRLLIADLSNRLTVAQEISYRLTMENNTEHNYKNELAIVSKWLDNLKEKINEKDQWTLRLTEALEYEKYLETKTAHEALLHTLRLKDREANEHLNEMHENLNTLVATNNKLKATIASILVAKERKDVWKTQLLEYDHMRQKLAQYPIRKEQHNRFKFLKDQQAIYLSVIQEKDLINAYDEWTTQFKTLSDNLDESQQQLSTIQSNIMVMQTCIEYDNSTNEHTQFINWSDWNNKLNGLLLAIYKCKKQKLNNDLITHSKTANLKKEKAYWTEITRIRPLWTEKTHLTEELKYLRKISQQLEITHLELSRISDEHTRTTNLKTINITIMKELERRKLTLDNLEILFGGYKNWIYKTVIIPKLVTTTNNMANHLLKNGQELVCEFLDENIPEKKTLHWIIKDACKASSIQRAGGYVSFVFGLLIRVAIASLGAASLTSEQIFIDEGFVSGSAKSLESIPDFMKHLRLMYSSVFLVTHTDIIKDTATISSSMKKNIATKALTQLQFGKQSKLNLRKLTYTESKKKLPSLTINTNVTPLPISNQNNNDQCKTLTKKGTQCKNKSLVGTNNCALHT